MSNRSYTRVIHRHALFSLGARIPPAAILRSDAAERRKARRARTRAGRRAPSSAAAARFGALNDSPLMKKRLARVKQLGLRVEPHRALPRARAGPEHHVRLRRAEVTRPGNPSHRARDQRIRESSFSREGEHAVGDACRMDHGREVRIAVRAPRAGRARAASRGTPRRAPRRAARESRSSRCSRPRAPRRRAPRRAGGTAGRPGSRDVLLRPAALHRRRPGPCSRKTSYESTCGPTPPPRRRVAHHHVVEARLRDEGEAPQQRVGRRHVQVDAADQQRPVRFPGVHFLERAVLRRPALAAPFHDPGFDVVARRERRERALVDHAGESGQRLRHEKRALLPITAQKITRRQTPSSVHRGDYM